MLTALKSAIKDVRVITATAAFAVGLAHSPLYKGLVLAEHMGRTTVGEAVITAALSLLSLRAYPALRSKLDKIKVEKAKLAEFLETEHRAKLKCPNCGRREWIDETTGKVYSGVEITYEPKFSDADRTVLCTCKNCHAQWGLPPIIPNAKWRIATR